MADVVIDNLETDIFDIDVMIIDCFDKLQVQAFFKRWNTLSWKKIVLKFVVSPFQKKLDSSINSLVYWLIFLSFDLIEFVAEYHGF